MALGAFVAGLLLAETEYRRAAEAMVEPFRGLLLGLFFVSVGLGLDLGLIGEQPWLVLGIVSILVAGKAALIFALASAFRTGRAAALEAALVLAPAGEFAFVVIDQASGLRLLPEPVAELALVAATLSMFAIPLLAALGSRLGRAMDSDDGPEVPLATERTVVIVGYGRVGRLVADMLGRHRIPHVTVDRDAKRVRAERERGVAIWFGDAGRPEMLERMGLGSASGLVVTLDEPGAAERVVEAARRLRPDLTIVARARDEAHAHRSTRSAPPTRCRDLRGGPATRGEHPDRRRRPRRAGDRLHPREAGRGPGRPQHRRRSRPASAAIGEGGERLSPRLTQGAALYLAGREAARNAVMGGDGSTPTYDEVVKGRRSIRGYLDKPVPRALIEEVIALAMRAPSSMNTQPWNFTVVTGEPLDRIRAGNTERNLAVCRTRASSGPAAPSRAATASVRSACQAAVLRHGHRPRGPGHAARLGDARVSAIRRPGCVIVTYDRDLADSDDTRSTAEPSPTRS
jgi:hypothetical protein